MTIQTSPPERTLACPGTARAGARYCCGSGLCQATAGSGLECRGAALHEAAMDTPPKQLPREERLAAKLRENLHRRKAQARAAEVMALPKAPPKS